MLALSTYANMSSLRHFVLLFLLSFFFIRHFFAGQGDGWEGQGLTPDASSNKCSAKIFETSLQTSVKYTKYKLLSSNPRTAKDLDIACAIDNIHWKFLGDFQIFAEVYLEDVK